MNWYKLEWSQNLGLKHISSFHGQGSPFSLLVPRPYLNVYTPTHLPKDVRPYPHQG